MLARYAQFGARQILHLEFEELAEPTVQLLGIKHD